MKPTRTIRLSEEGRKQLGQGFARLTLNPVLIDLSQPYIQWEGRLSSAKLSPQELVLKAQKAFPKLPLSWAVEGYIAGLLAGQSSGRLWEAAECEPIEPEEQKRLDRFRQLTPTQKIRYGQRAKRTLEMLRGLKP